MVILVSPTLFESLLVIRDAPPIEYVKVSGGMLFDMTIHDFDMVRYLSGSEVTEVYAAEVSLLIRKLVKRAILIPQSLP